MLLQPPVPVNFEGKTVVVVQLLMTQDVQTTQSSFNFLFIVIHCVNQPLTTQIVLANSNPSDHRFKAFDHNHHILLTNLWIQGLKFII